MEPRSFKRGNFFTQTRVPRGTYALQWSRALSSAETPSAPCGPRPLGRASMEPRSFKRGNNLLSGTQASVDAIASMEPRSFKRGNIANVSPESGE